MHQNFLTSYEEFFRYFVYAHAWNYFVGSEGKIFKPIDSDAQKFLTAKIFLLLRKNCCTFLWLRMRKIICYISVRWKAKESSNHVGFNAPKFLIAKIFNLLKKKSSDGIYLWACAEFLYLFLPIKEGKIFVSIDSDTQKFLTTKIFLLLVKNLLHFFMGAHAQYYLLLFSWLEAYGWSWSKWSITERRCIRKLILNF